MSEMTRDEASRCDACGGKGKVQPARDLLARPDDDEAAYKATLKPITCWKCGGSGQALSRPEPVPEDVESIIAWAEGRGEPTMDMAPALRALAAERDRLAAENERLRALLNKEPSFNSPPHE